MKTNDLRREIAADPTLAGEDCNAWQDLTTYLWSGNTLARLIAHARLLGLEAYVLNDTNLLVWRRTRIYVSGPAGQVLNWFDDLPLFR